MKLRKIISILLAAALCMSFLVGCGSGNKEVDQTMKFINSIFEQQGIDECKYKFKNKTKKDGMTFLNYENISYTTKYDDNLNIIGKSDTKDKTVCTFIFDGDFFVGMLLNTTNHSNNAYMTISGQPHLISPFHFTDENIKELQGYVPAFEPTEIIGGYYITEFLSFEGEGKNQEATYGNFYAIHQDYVDRFDIPEKDLPDLTPFDIPMPYQKY